MADLTVYYADADAITALTTGAVVGGHLVKVSATRADGGNVSVVTAGAGEVVFGVAGHDAASGTRVTVIRQGIVGLKASEAITAGQRVMVAASGEIAVATAATALVPTISGNAETNVAATVTAGGVVIGVAVADIAHDAFGPVALNL